MPLATTELVKVKNWHTLQLVIETVSRLVNVLLQFVCEARREFGHPTKLLSD